MQENEHDETVPIISQDTTDRVRSKGSYNGFENKLRLKFAQMAEQNQHLMQIIARIETTTATSQLQLHEQLAEIRSSITKLTEATINIQQLRAEIEIERKEHDIFRQRESILEKSIAILSAHIASLQESNKDFMYVKTLLKINIMFIILFVFIVFYHVFFE